jgi:signal transduction histidine kinase
MSNSGAKIIHMTDRGPLKSAGTKPIAEDELSSDLAHDLRTPLNIIIGFSELLLEEIPGRLNEEQRLDITDILNSGRRLLNLVNAILERYEAGNSRKP